MNILNHLLDANADAIGKKLNGCECGVDAVRCKIDECEFGVDAFRWLKIQIRMRFKSPAHPHPW